MTTEVSFTCPRCFYTGPALPQTKFCPRCGLANVQEAAADTSPLEVRDGDREFRVLDRIALGSVAAIYRCEFKSAGEQVEGIFKIARDPITNDLLANEAAVLKHLHRAKGADRFAAFLPMIEASFLLRHGSPPRQANVLRMHDTVHSPADEFYSLEEVKAQHPNGLDPRDMAWIWRRLLTVLGFLHAADIVHGAVLPMHVLIEPREHKLVLIDFCCAIKDAHRGTRPITILTGMSHQGWYKREGALRDPPKTTLDIGFAARCMIDLMGGDGSEETFPADLDPALVRYFQRCFGGTDTRRDASVLLGDFDRLIEALWGPRRFRVLEMAPKHRA